MADEFTALKRDPLSAKTRAVSSYPLLFLQPRGARWQIIRQVGNGQEHVLALIERQRLKWTQNPLLEYGFQMLHHHLILTRVLLCGGMNGCMGKRFRDTPMGLSPDTSG